MFGDVIAERLHPIPHPATSRVFPALLRGYLLNNLSTPMKNREFYEGFQWNNHGFIRILFRNCNKCRAFISEFLPQFASTSSLMQCPTVDQNYRYWQDIPQNSTLPVADKPPMRNIPSVAIKPPMGEGVEKWTGGSVGEEERFLIYNV